MSIEYLSDADAQRQPGLRMVYVKGVPSPWGEAAKGILHHKDIAVSATYLDVTSDAQAAWTGGLRSAPIAVYNDEAPIGGWREILMLAERLAPTPSLLPADPQTQERVLLLSHLLCGENGLGWVRRVQAIDAGLRGEGGFPKPVAEYLGNKYGFSADSARNATARVVELLALFTEQLTQQARAESPYLVGDSLSAADFYCAAFMGLFAPLPSEQCAMHPRTRAAFETLDAATAAALDPILLRHRDHLYNTAMALPLSL